MSDLNIIGKENAIYFMLYSYFGIKKTTDKLDIIQFAIDFAYRDAARHVLSFGDYGNEESRKQKKNDARKDSTETIREAIDKLKEIAETCNKEQPGVIKKIYDDWHEELTTKKLQGIYANYKFKDKYKFTCGIAQKWVNMTMKYIYIFISLFQNCSEKSDFESEYGVMIQTFSKYFHVPIDSYIIKAAREELGVDCEFNGWSKIDSYEKYFEFQDKIRGNSNLNEVPIDWESQAWIKVAPQKKPLPWLK